MRIICPWIRNSILPILRYETVQYFLLILYKFFFLGCACEMNSRWKVRKYRSKSTTRSNDKLLNVIFLNFKFQFFYFSFIREGGVEVTESSTNKQYTLSLKHANHMPLETKQYTANIDETVQYFLLISYKWVFLFGVCVRNKF